MIHSRLFGRTILNSLLAAGFVTALAAPALARHHDAASTTAPSATVAAPVDLGSMTTALETQLKASPSDVSTTLKLADAYLQGGRPNDALRLVTQLEAGGVKTPQVYFFDGVANRQLGHLELAMLALEKAEALDPTSSLVLIELSNVYTQVNRLPEATRVAERAAKFNPKDERSLLNYGVILAIQKQYDLARAQFETAMILAPKDPIPPTLEARTYSDQGQSMQALAMYDRILSFDAANIDALDAKAVLLGSAHQVEASIATFEALYAVVPKPELKADVLTQEARLYVAEHRDAQALAVLQREVTNFPMLVEPHIALGDYYLAANQPEQAQAQWKIAAGPDQTGRVGLSRLGDYALKTKDAQGAVSDYMHVLAIDNRDDAAWFHLGQAYEALNQFDRARVAFRKAFAIHPSAESLAQIGTTGYFLHDYADANNAFDQLALHATQFINQDPRLLFLMGKSYEAANQRGKARGVYTRVLSFVKPGSSDERTVKGLISNLDQQASKRGSKAPTQRPAKH